MLNLSVEDVLLLVVLWLVCGLFSAAVFIRWSVLRWAGKAMINALMKPTDETRAAVGSLLGLILSSEVQTGKMILEGKKEVPETIPFLLYLGREIWKYLGTMGKASNGGMTSKALNDLGLPALGPRKGQSSLEFLLEQTLFRMGPKLDEIVTKKIENALGNQGDRIL